MPGPLANRGDGKGRPPRFPRSMPRAGVPSLRRLAIEPRPVDQGSALPPDVIRALRLVAAELRSMPRECARDREELVFWHTRLARRLDAVVASKARVVVAPRPAPEVRRPTPGKAPQSAPAPHAEPASGLVRQAVEFRVRKAPRALPARSAPATRWRARPIDASFRRRAEAAGQLVLLA